MNGTQVIALVDRLHAPTAAVSRPQGKLRRAAGALSRRTVHQARAELCMQRLHLAAAMLYEVDDAGELVNVDADTGRILIPLPWGRAGRSPWGLTGNEGDTLRYIVRAWALFWYDASGRTWCVDLGRYPTAEAAHDYIERHAITVSTWRQAWAATYRPR